MNRIHLLILAALVTCSSFAGGCSATRNIYYNTWEKFGYAKRERLVDNVKDARKEQVEAKQEFANALEQFKSVVNFNGGDLEKLYNKLDKERQLVDTFITSKADAIVISPLSRKASIETLKRAKARGIARAELDQPEELIVLKDDGRDFRTGRRIRSEGRSGE